AIAELQTAVKNDPSSPSVRFYLGEAHLQSNDRKSAESEFTEATRTAGAFPPPYIALARIRLDSGDTEGAARLARQALAIRSNLAEAQLILALTSANRDEFRNATAKLEEILKENPSETLQVELAGAYLGKGEAGNAEAHLDSVLKSNPDSPDAMAGLVQLYVADKKPEKAIARLLQQTK